MSSFFRPKHNIQNATAPVHGINSVFTEEAAYSASAHIAASGSAIRQIGRSPIKMADVPGVSAAIIPSGETLPTGYSNLFAIPQFGTPSAHIFAYSPEIVSAYFESGSWIPESDAG